MLKNSQNEDVIPADDDEQEVEAENEDDPLEDAQMDYEQPDEPLDQPENEEQIPEENVPEVIEKSDNTVSEAAAAVAVAAYEDEDEKFLDAVGQEVESQQKEPT